MKIKLVRPKNETLEQIFCEHQIKDPFAKKITCKFCGKIFRDVK